MTHSGWEIMGIYTSYDGKVRYRILFDDLVLVRIEKPGKFKVVDGDIIPGTEYSYDLANPKLLELVVDLIENS